MITYLILLDTFEQYRDFRLANGRKAGAEENEAFTHLLSNMKLSCKAAIREVKSDHEEIFFDCHDSI